MITGCFVSTGRSLDQAIERVKFADAAVARGDSEAMRMAISDRFLDALTAVGDEDAVRTGSSATEAPGSRFRA